MAIFHVLFSMIETVLNLKTVLPGPAKPSLPLHPKMMAILAPFTATLVILIGQKRICAKIYSYNRKISHKILFIRTCMLIFIKMNIVSLKKVTAI
jgi:hypothetical protein